MLTLEKLRELDIHKDVAKEAMAQAEKRLMDTLETKKTFEQKAFTLFNAFITISLALIGVGGTLMKGSSSVQTALPFFVAGVFFVAGAIIFANVLLDSKYGALGSDPEMWLVDDVINGSDKTLPTMMAYLTHHHHERIKQGMRSNRRKAHLIRCGISLGAAAPFFLLGLFLCC